MERRAAGGGRRVRAMPGPVGCFPERFTVRTAGHIIANMPD